MAAGLVASGVAAGLNFLSLATRGADGFFNDFYDYWGAARLIATGHNPYDNAAMASLLAGFGVHFQVGTGYSYPAFFAVLLLPLAALPPLPAAWVFTGLSLLAFAAALAILLSPLSRLHWLELFVLAGLAGGFTAVTGSIYFGQANLLVLPLLAAAARGVARPLTLAVAAAIKLYPAAGLVALAGRGVREARALLAAVALTGGLVLLPNLVLAGSGSAGGDRLAGFFAPDPFWTNQSINGWVSRLGLSSDSTMPPLPGLPVTPTMLAVVALLGLAATAVVFVRRGSPWDGCLALMLGWAVVAAPKNSLWNYTPLLLALVFCWPRSRTSPLRLGVLLGGYALVELQSRIDIVRETFYAGSPGLTWLSSLALYGALAICVLCGYLVLRAPPAEPPAEPPQEAG